MPLGVVCWSEDIVSERSVGVGVASEVLGIGIGEKTVS
jgi:hypothetical protein